MSEPQKHPSFGVVSLRRVSSSPPGQALFDSPFRHQHFITMSIHRATKQRTDLHDDMIHDAGELIEVAMSEAQFARMVTSPNIGVGTPCTITHLDGDFIESCPMDATKETFVKETKEEFKAVGDRLSELQDLIEKMMKKDRMNAADKEALKKAAFEASRTVNDHLPFLQTQFEEKMDQVVQNAKVEIEAHVNAVIHKTGLDMKRSELPTLEAPKKEQS